MKKINYFRTKEGKENDKLMFAFREEQDKKLLKINKYGKSV